jgi:DNA-binding transcriptional regulator YbjK
MAPPRNTRRRNALADAAVAVLGSAGIHKLSHRAVDESAGLPAGTAANYFPRRDDLLAAAAERVAALQAAEMTAADQAAAPAVAGGATGLDAFAQLIGASLYDSATRHRVRYLAAYELALESTRQPSLATALAQLGAAAIGTTAAEHRALGLPASIEQAQALIALYGGTLLTLVVAPPGSVTPEMTLALARYMVSGVFGAGVNAERG